MRIMYNLFYLRQGTWEYHGQLPTEESCRNYVKTCEPEERFVVKRDGDGYPTEEDTRVMGEHRVTMTDVPQRRYIDDLD